MILPDTVKRIHFNAYHSAELTVTCFDSSIASVAESGQVEVEVKLPAAVVSSAAERFCPCPVCLSQ